VAKSALKITLQRSFWQNHPSDTTEISQQDKHITQRMIKALVLVEACVLDHYKKKVLDVMRSTGIEEYDNPSVTLSMCYINPMHYFSLIG